MTARRWTDEQVRAFRDRYRAGESATAIAKAEGVKLTAVQRMLNGLSYADVPGRVKAGTKGKGKHVPNGGAWTNERRTA